MILATVLAAGVRSELSQSFCLVTDLELGTTLSGVSFFSDAEQAAGLSGLIVAAQVGVELKL